VFAGFLSVLSAFLLELIISLSEMEINSIPSPEPQPDSKSKKKKKKKSKRRNKSESSKGADDSNVVKLFDIRSTLTEKQLSTLETLRESMQSYLKNNLERKWCSDYCLCRYLRARDWDLDKAKELLIESLSWRREYKPHCITAEDVLRELKNEGKMYRNGKDKLGRSIIYMKPGLDNTTPEKEKELKVKYLVYLLEKAILAMDETQGAEKIVWIIDYRNYSSPMGLSSFSYLKMAKEIVDILQNHYPERLAVAFVISAPWFFSLFWKMVSPFLNDVTKNKLKIINGNDFSPIYEIIDLDELEEDYGGKCAFKYNFDTHWNREDILFPPCDPDEVDSKN